MRRGTAIALEEAMRFQRITGLTVKSLVSIGDKNIVEDVMSSKDSKDFRALLQELPRQGWTVEPTERGHWRARPPDQAHGLVHFSESGDSHAQMNIIRDLRRRGFVWPPPSKNEQAGAERMAKDATERLQTELLDRETKPPPRRQFNGIKGLSELAEEQVKAAPLQVVVPSAVIPPADRVGAKTEDQLFNELKEARLMDSLAGDSLKTAKQKLEAAQRELEHAEHEKRMAADDLLKKKAAFDAAYVPS